MLFVEKLQGIGRRGSRSKQIQNDFKKMSKNYKRKHYIEVCGDLLLEDVNPFRKANDNCKSLGQKISSHGLYFRRLKDLHILWIQQGNSTALKQYNKEWVVLISVEHQKPANISLHVGKIIYDKTSEHPMTDRILFFMYWLESTVHYIPLKSALAA